MRNISIQFKTSLINLSAFFGFLAIWEFFSRQGFIPSFLIPSPVQILSAFKENPDLFLQGFQQTAKNSCLGFLFSVALGFILGAILSMNQFMNRLIYPIASFFQTVPIIAIAPLLVIYFGYGDKTVQASAFIVSLFPMIANAVVGLSSAPREYIELYQYAKASPLQILIDLRLGFALPVIFSGLKISSGLAIIGAIAGEFVAGGGLGQIIDVARTQQRIDQVYLVLFLLSLLGFLYLTVIQILQRTIQIWRPYFPSADNEVTNH